MRSETLTRQIVLISCVKSKKKESARAEELYISDWFRKALQYARTLNPDNIFVLSAEHGLLSLGDVIEPYEKTLNTMGVSARRVWAADVLCRLQGLTDLKKDCFVILAGEKYREFLVPEIEYFTIPMKGLRQGQQKSWLKEQLNQ